MGCCRPPSPCPGHPDREACARKWPCALRRAVCELWQGRRAGTGRTRSCDGMAAPLSSKERVSQLAHGERRGEKGGVAGDVGGHSDNSQKPPEPSLRMTTAGFRVACVRVVLRRLCVVRAWVGRGCGGPVATRRADALIGMDQSGRTTGRAGGLNNRRRVTTDTGNQQLTLPGPVRKALIWNKRLQRLQGIGGGGKMNKRGEGAVSGRVTKAPPKFDGGEGRCG